jgi:hypothetical protein
MVAGSYVAYAVVGWFLAGLGAALPELRDQIGGIAGLYPLLPGAVIAATGLVSVRRHRAEGPGTPHHRALIIGVIGTAAGVGLMGVTAWRAVGLLGAIAAALAVALLIRYLPGVLATARPDDVEQVLTRANAWSSLGSIAGPAAVGGTIALGIGWLPGMAVPLGVASVGSVVLLRTTVDRGAWRARRATRQSGAPERSAADIPSLATWWRPWMVLWLGIVVEFCFSYFAATFLHDERGLSTAAAAAGAAVWGVGMTAGRFLVGMRRPSGGVLPSAAMITIGFVLFWAVGNPWVSVLGILVAGLGAAPLYPSRVSALLARFPSAPDQGSTRGSLASGFALLTAPALMIALREVSDVRRAYLAVPVLLAGLVLLAWEPARALPTRDDGSR